MKGKPNAYKPTKARRKPIKILYISDPKIVKASVSEFRTLVQELTGQGSPLRITRSHKCAIGASETGISTATNTGEVFDDEVSSIVSSFKEDDLEKEMRNGLWSLLGVKVNLHMNSAMYTCCKRC